MQKIKQPKLQSLFVGATFVGVTSIGGLNAVSYAEQVSQTNNNIEHIVVTAAGFEQAIAQAPASISVIDSEELNKKSYTDITDAIKNIPGLFMTGGGSTKDISVRGMNAEYTLFLVDGRPVSSGRTIHTNGTDSGRHIGLPPIDQIERIEVIRGPMSSLYGSEAMGGVVNIITKQPTGDWQTTLRAEYTKSDNDLNRDAYQVGLATSGALIDEILSMQFNLSQRGTQESHYVGGAAHKADSSTPKGSDQQAGLVLQYTPNTGNKFQLAYDLAQQERISTPGKSIALEQAGSELEYEKKRLLLSHDGRYAGFYWSSYIQQDESEKIQDRQRKETIQSFNSQLSYFGDLHVTSAGINYKKERLIDEANGLLTSGIPGASDSAERWQYALFTEVEWHFFEDFQLTTGFRYNKDELFGGHVTPRIYGNYELSSSWTIKAGISTGYKQPKLSQVHPGFGLGTGGPGSPAPHPRALIIGNPDLNPEKSTNYEIGFVYEGLFGLQSSLMLFKTDFNHKIAEDRFCDLGGDREDASTWQCEYSGNQYLFLSRYENIDKAMLRGVEFSFSAPIAENLDFRSSYTYTESEQKTGKFVGQPLNKMPKHMLNLNLDWHLSPALELWSQANFRGKTSDFLNRTSIAEGTPGYLFYDLGLTYQVSQKLSFKSGLYNILNKRVDNEHFGAVLDGRRINLGATYHF